MFERKEEDDKWGRYLDVDEGLGVRQLRRRAEGLSREIQRGELASQSLVTPRLYLSLPICTHLDVSARLMWHPAKNMTTDPRHK